MLFLKEEKNKEKEKDVVKKEKEKELVEDIQININEFYSFSAAIRRKGKKREE
jgi:hypothetical protein